jgi:hypothetical protein
LCGDGFAALSAELYNRQSMKIAYLEKRLSASERLEIKQAVNSYIFIVCQTLNKKILEFS